MKQNGKKKMKMKTVIKITMPGLIIGLAVLSVLSAAGIVWCMPANTLEPVKVAILDSGSNTAFKEGISLIDSTIRDYNGHGTLMAEIIKEICPEAELYVVKVIGSDGLAVNEEALILGLQWAVSRGVDVINMSLSLKGSLRLHQAVKKAYERGILIIAAAGNREEVLNEVAYPARYREVTAVGALNRFGRAYDASIDGEEVDVYIRGYKGEKAGTSIASAYASGLTAKIISENPGVSAGEIKNIIKVEVPWRG